MKALSVYLRPHLITNYDIIALDVELPFLARLIYKYDSPRHQGIVLKVYSYNNFLYQVSYHKDKFQRSHKVVFI